MSHSASDFIEPIELKHIKTMLKIWADIRGAFAFLTTLPVGWPTVSHLGHTPAYYPLVGVVVGAALYGVASLDFLTPDMRAFLALLTWIVLTGGLHLDGWGDACDGLLATVEPERRLAIMKDSRAGSWAVIGLVLLLLGKWIALREVPPSAALLLPPVIGRWALVLAIGGFAYARPSGIGGTFREGFGRRQIMLASLLTGLIVFLIASLCGWPVLALVLVAPIIVTLAGGWAARQLGGGLTGDVYGALCELTEVICLLLLTWINA